MRRIRHLILLAGLLAVSTPVILGQEEEEEEHERDLVDVDTCGSLAGRRVLYIARTEESWSRDPFHEAIEVAHSIVMESGSDEDSEARHLLSWTSDAHPSDLKQIKVKASGKDLKLYWKDDNLLVAHFVYTDTWIKFAPAFRRRIEKGFAREDSTLSWYGLHEILPAFRMQDAHVAQVVELLGLRGVIQGGNLDLAIQGLQEVLSSAADDTIRRYGNKLLDSVTALKQEAQPADLVGARKIGKLL